MSGWRSGEGRYRHRNNIWGQKDTQEDSRGTKQETWVTGFRAEADSHIQREINKHYPLTCVRNGIE